jgi:glycosyltransferase involved in cell wall biosynthesis/SAM-dependent methyltransferase
MHICTIIAKNYVAHARVLARSFAEHHANGSCSVLVIDDYEDYLDPVEEPFTILTPEQIGCEEFQEMALRYDVLELSTAVKPWLLAFLLEEGVSTITYLDPDIRIYSSLAVLDELARSHGVVLTPHNTKPLPDDGMRPSQIDILLAGVYNLGYVSLRAGEENQNLLRWWRDRLLTDCRVDPFNGYFVDQRWFDLAPALASDHLILREPQYNLAYWNIHSRDLQYNGNGYKVNGESLAFFHFSGFDPERPGFLSRHQTRVSVNEGTALERICTEYSGEVNEAGYGEVKHWPYTYHSLPSGAGFNRRLRKLYRIAVERDEVVGSPFTVAGCTAFMTWLAEPAAGAPPGINRLLADLYGTRTDLQEAFPDVADGDHDSFLRWAEDSGVSEEPALAVLARLVPQPSQPRGAVPPGPDDSLISAEQVDSGIVSEENIDDEVALPWGVNVVGYFRSELGTGEAARQVVSALDAQGIPALPIHGRTIPPNRQGHSFTHLDPVEARYPVNVICINADVLGEFAAQVGRNFFDGRYSIGVWFWEVEQFPGIWGPAFEHLHELWLPTEHIVRAIAPMSSIPITKITLPVELPPVRPASRTELNLPDGFMFLFSFDHHSVFERKNPLAVIKAYTRSFEPDDGAVLVIKSINAESAPDDHARLLAAADSRADIHVIDGYLSPELKNMMVAACDCYVSLHRAEGFGLTMAEAMYLGKPVVATGYSGNLDFMDRQNSYLVEHSMVPIGFHAKPYPGDGQWAEPDLDHAARLMREIFDDPSAATKRGLRGSEDIRRSHSAVAAGEILGQRLELLRELRGDRVNRLGRRVTTVLDQRVQAGPLVEAASRFGRPGRLARRILLRVLKPFSIYQKGINTEVAQSMHELERRIEKLDLVTTQRHALVLARLRNEDSERRVWESIAGLRRSTMGLELATTELQRMIDLPDVGRRLEEVARSLEGLKWESRAIPFMEGAPFGDIKHPGAGLVQGYRLDHDAAGVDTYRTFEDIFRGSEEFIRLRQEVYLELLDGHSPVLDFGCGRGEFLDLLREHDVGRMGVDSDAGMVARCREKGHTEVVLADGLRYLETLEDGTLGAIFCAQVIEHLPYHDLLSFLALARLKLCGDGILIAETVNPHSLAALKTFWVDLTHQHPIFPEVALALCRSSGFPAAFVFHPNGTGDVEQDRFTQGEYAVVAGPEMLLLPQAD